MKNSVISCLLVAMSALLPASAGAQAAPADRWPPVRFMLGNWQGEARGEPGQGTVERSYRLVLGDRFIEEHNTSRYEPKAAGQEPEVHPHRSFISYDKARQTLMLRQNFSDEWKAREIYEVRSDDEFIETFELAAPGKEFQVYSHNHFRRRK